MKEFIEKLIDRLEEEILTCQSAYTESIIGMCGKSAENYMSEIHAYIKTKQIVNQIAEEHEAVAKNATTTWIPVSERLPEVSMMRVWLSFRTDIMSFVRRAWWIDNHFEWDNGKKIKDKPLAWMPYAAPKPYQPEENSKDCSSCANNTEPDEVDNGCYMRRKGLEDNYEPEGE